MKAKIALLLSAVGIVTSGAALAALNSPALTRLVSQAFSLPTSRPDLMDVVSSVAPAETLAPEPKVSSSVETDDEVTLEDEDDTELNDSDDDSQDSDDSSEDASDDDESDNEESED
jgi:hypothetical protein